MYLSIAFLSMYLCTYSLVYYSFFPADPKRKFSFPKRIKCQFSITSRNLPQCIFISFRKLPLLHKLVCNSVSLFQLIIVFYQLLLYNNFPILIHINFFAQALNLILTQDKDGSARRRAFIFSNYSDFVNCRFQTSSQSQGSNQTGKTGSQRSSQPAHSQD